MLLKIKRWLWLIGVLFFVAFMTIALLAPDSISEFINSISGFIRFIMVIIMYVVVAMIVYRTLYAGAEDQFEGLLVKSAGSITSIGTEDARQAVYSKITALPVVQSADVTVKERNGKAVFLLNVQAISDETPLADKQKQINDTLTQTITQLGVQTAETPVIHVKMGETTQ